MVAEKQSPSDTDDCSSSLEELGRKVKLQYQHVEEYCNAQTRLRNALIEEDRRVQMLMLQGFVDQLQRSVQKVQKDQSDLKAASLGNQRRQQALEEHVARSERVLRTVLGSGGTFHTDGIPASSDDVGLKTLALATLRASSKELQRKLGLA